MSENRPLNVKQSAFVEHYIANGGNATAAARAAGYSPAPGAVHDLVTRPHIKAALDEIKRSAADRAGISADFLMQHLAAIIGFDVAKLYAPDGTMRPVHELDAETRRAISEIEEKQFGRKTKAYDKLSAITLAMKHLGLLVDRVEHSGEVQVVGMAQRIRERAAKAAPDASLEGFA